MKILQVLGGGAWGGGSVVVMAITKALIARGDEVWMACYDDENAGRFREAGVRIVRPPLWFHPINPFDIIPFAYLVGLCRKERFDLVATHTSKGGFLGRFAARLGGVPHIIHHAHGFSFNKALSPLAHRFFVALERAAASAGDYIISVNDEHRRMAVELGVSTPENICTVHNGIEIAPLDLGRGRKLRQEFGFSDSDLLIGAVGRMAPQKGFIYLIRAMPRVIEAVPSARLLLAGEGPLFEDLKEAARRTGVADRIHFLGFRRDIPELLAASDVFALPSLWEGLSISLIEALAAGKAIVATDIDGNREVVEHRVTALVVPAAQPDAFAEALSTLLIDRSLAERLAANARRSAETRFSVRRMVQENLAVYDRVTAAGRRGAQRTTSEKWTGGPSHKLRSGERLG